MTEPKQAVEKLRGKDLVSQLGISKGHASGVLSGTQTPSLKLAVSIYRSFGVKLGPLAGASIAEIKALERMQARRAG